MSLTFQNLRQLEWSLRRAGPAPDPVTAFAIQQQALHEKDDAWRPHISDNSGEMWGTNHIVQPYEERRQRRQHRAQEDIDLQETKGVVWERKSEPQRLSWPGQPKRVRECSLSSSPLEYAELDTDRGNSLMVDYGGDGGVVRDGRKNNNFRKRARYKMLDEGCKTADRAIPSKLLLSQKKKNEEGKGKDGAPLGKGILVGVTNGRRTLPATSKMEVTKNNRAHVFKNGGGLPDLTFNDMNFLAQGQPQAPAARNTTAGVGYGASRTSSSPRCGPSRTRSAVSVARWHELPSQCSPVVRGPLHMESSSPAPQGTITTNTSAHSEYSLNARRSRKYGVGGPSPGTTRLSQNAATSSRTPSKGPPCLPKDPTPGRVSEKGPITTDPTDSREGQSSGPNVQPDPNINDGPQLDHLSAAGFVGNASSLYAEAYYTDPIDHRSCSNADGRGHEYIRPQRREANTGRPGPDAYTYHQESAFMYNHSAHTPFDASYPNTDHFAWNAPSRAINGNTEDGCLQDPQYRAPCAQDYRAIVDSPYQLSSHSSRIRKCMEDQSLYQQEYPPVVTPSWSGSHMTGVCWNSQQPVDTPRPVIGRHSDRQFRDDFPNAGSHLDQQFRDDFSNVGSHLDPQFRDDFSTVGSHLDQHDFSNVGNRFDRQRRDDFANGGSRFDRQLEVLPKLDIEGFFDRHLREEVGIELDLRESF